MRWPSFLRDGVAGYGQIGDDAVGAAFGMPRLTATSRNRAPGSRAMHGSARAWLVGKLQLATLDTLPKNSRNTLLVSDCRCRLGADTGETAADGDQLPPGSPRGAAHGLPARSSSSPCSRCRALSGGSCRCRRVISPGQIPWPGEMLTGAATRCMPSLPVTSRQARSARDCRRGVDDLRAQVTMLEDVPASRGKAAG